MRIPKRVLIVLGRFAGGRTNVEGDRESKLQVEEMRICVGTYNQTTPGVGGNEKGGVHQNTEG
jgi:hypothetical protein